MKTMNISSDFNKYDTNDISSFVLHSLSSCDNPQAFVKRVYEEFHMPIIITDMAFRFVAYGGMSPCPDPLWQEIIDSGAAAPEVVINTYFGEGFTDKMIASDGPIDASWGSNTDYPQTTCAVKIGNSSEGCCSVMYMDKDKLDFALKLNSAIADAVSVYFSGKRSKSIANTPHERMSIARFLLENTSTPVSLLYGTNFYKTEKFHSNYFVAVLTSDKPNAARLQNVVSCIKAKYPNLLYLNKGNDIYLYFWNIRSEGHRKRLIADIVDEAKDKISIICGVSGLFYDPEMRKEYIEQARLAMEHGLQIGASACYSFYDCYYDILLKMGYENISKNNIILPEIKALLAYDRDNNTNFFETLDCYLDEYCDITNAAAKLFIHRNSMLYRIKKCEDIMGVALKDKSVRKRLNLCCSLMKLKTENRVDSNVES